MDQRDRRCSTHSGHRASLRLRRQPADSIGRAVADAAAPARTYGCPDAASELCRHTSRIPCMATPAEIAPSNYPESDIADDIVDILW